MPIVLQRGAHVNVTPPQLYFWLQLAIEFYINYITQPGSGEGDSGGGGEA